MNPEVLRTILRRQPVLPILTVRGTDPALHIAESLLAGGCATVGDPRSARGTASASTPSGP